MANTVAYLNLALTFYSIYMVGMQERFSGKTYFRTIWAYLDIAYCGVNGFISIALLNDGMIDVEALRIIESILSIIIVGKLIYFT